MRTLNYLVVSWLICLSHTVGANSTTKAGDTLQILIPVLAFSSTFYVGDDEGRTQFYKSFASTVLLTHGGKRIFNKRRPDDSDNKAFPSGHTSAAFQGAAFIHFRYGFRYAIPGYLAASFVGYSRVDARKHDYADVLAGAAVGIASSWFFTQPWMNPLLEPVKGVNLTPTVRKDGFKFIFSKHW
ncbi:hypothetical protein ACH42_05700 [Endozoicomonas sp. (ex Bugula neritina AB1)]|nr:hypothetical protein ACH42_05700 [Endozoicomonas sp. (ex Bugula neritina AB1)]